jgi:hypothetical protein
LRKKEKFKKRRAGIEKEDRNQGWKKRGRRNSRRKEKRVTRRKGERKEEKQEKGKGF